MLQVLKFGRHTGSSQRSECVCVYECVSDACGAVLFNLIVSGHTHTAFQWIGVRTLVAGPALRSVRVCVPSASRTRGWQVLFGTSRCLCGCTRTERETLTLMALATSTYLCSIVCFSRSLMWCAGVDRYHPDRNQKDPNAEKMFQGVAEGEWW
jgi:hypothetical protein